MKRKTAISLVSVAILGAAITAASSAFGSTSPDFVQWPIHAEYTINANEGGDAGRRSTFVWEAISLMEWTNVQTCCDEYEGLTVRVEADGRVFVGGERGAPIEYSYTHEPHDGMIPLPDLAPRFPVDPSELGKIGGLTLLADVGLSTAQADATARLASIAEELGVSPADLVAYRTTSPEGHIDRWVYQPLNIPLVSEEWEGGILVRQLVINELRGWDS